MGIFLMSLSGMLEIPRLQAEQVVLESLFQ